MKKKVLVGTVCYSLPACIGPLLSSIRSDKYNLTVSIHQNGGFEKMTKAVDEAMDANKGRGVVLVHHWRAKNVGLSPCWNELILEAFRDQDPYDALILLNDDIILGERDVDIFAEAAMDHAGECHVVTCIANHALHGSGVPIGYSAFAFCRKGFEVLGMFDEMLVPCYVEDSDMSYRSRLAGLHEAGVKLDLLHGGSKHLLDNEALHVEAIRARNGVTQGANHDYYRRKWGSDPGKETLVNPFGDFRFNYRIAPEDRHRPYPGYERDDIPQIITI